MGHRGSCFDLCHRVFSYGFRSYIVSGLTFRSLIHFEFVFSVRKCSNFILLHVAVQFSQHHLLKRLSFHYSLVLPPLSYIYWPQVHGFISRLSILFHWSVFLSLKALWFLRSWPLSVLRMGSSLTNSQIGMKTDLFQSCGHCWIFQISLHIECRI